MCYKTLNNNIFIWLKIFVYFMSENPLKLYTCVSPLLPVKWFEGNIDSFVFLSNIVVGLWLVLNPFPNKPWFLHVCSKRLLKTLWEKEKLLKTSNFSFSHSVLYPFAKLSFIFIKLKIVVCKPFEFGRV